MEDALREKQEADIRDHLPGVMDVMDVMDGMDMMGVMGVMGMIEVLKVIRVIVGMGNRDVMPLWM